MKEKIKKNLWIIIIIIAVIVIGYIGYRIIGGINGIKEILGGIKEILGIEEQVDGEDGTYREETSEGIEKNALESGKYYIKHGEKYYELYSNVVTNIEETESGSNNERVMMSNAENAKSIPTLYIGAGDKLVYYNTQARLQYVTYERFKDLGCSLGLYGLTSDYSGMYQITRDTDNDTNYIYDGSSASQIINAYPEEETLLTFTGIGQEELDKSHLTNTGIILGLEEGGQYDCDIYNGTEYNHFVLTADTRFFSGMEMYIENKVPLVKEGYQEIEIPEYMLNGYYLINHSGIVRIVRESYYTLDTEFNERLLEIDIDFNSSTGEYEESEIEATSTYSESIPSKNLYSPTKEGSFGYVAAEEGTEEETEVATSDEVTKIEEAKVEEIEVYFEKDKEYTLIVKSEEGYGEVYLKSKEGSSVRKGTEYFSKEETEEGYEYKYTIVGTGEKDTVIISGFTKDISYDFNGAENITEENIPEETEEEAVTEVVE